MTKSTNGSASSNDPAEADRAAGYRTVIDRNEAAELSPDNPNVASAAGDYDHERHIGDETDDDYGVSEILRRLDAGETL